MHISRLAYHFIGVLYTELRADLVKQVPTKKYQISITVSNHYKSITFGTESAKNQLFFTCYSSLQFILLKITVSTPLK